MPSAAPRFRFLATLLLFGVVAVGVVFAVRMLVGGDGRGIAAPSPSPSPSPVVVEPSPEPVEQPDAFKVKITRTKSQTMGNGRIYGRASGKRTPAVRKASRGAVKELARYLTDQFVDPSTRFKARPANRLLSRRAEDVVGRKQRRALGVGAEDIEGGRTGKARARTIVLHDGRQVFAVTVKYDARMKIKLDGRKLRPLRQRGSMVFVPTKNGWRADMVDVTLRLPGEGKDGGGGGGKGGARGKGGGGKGGGGKGGDKK